MIRTEDSTVMGKITSVYGVKGWVKVFSYTQPKENIAKYPVWILEQNGKTREIDVLACKAHGNGLVAQLKGYTDREQARLLADTLVRVPTKQLPDLEAGDYYWHQLEGLEVHTTSGELLGKVGHMMETGANDVMVVKPCAGSMDRKERLIPYLVDQVVVSVDLDAGKIRVDWDTEF